MHGRTLGYLGPPGTFSEEAAHLFIKAQARKSHGWRLVPLSSIDEIVEAVASGDLEKGIIPLENSIEGSINVTTDCIMKHPEIKLEGEVIVDVDHCLAVKQHSSDSSDQFRGITTLYSHPQALAQCKGYIQRRLPGAEIRYAPSTAEAASLVASGGADLAAICSPWAARVYGLDILAYKIQDYPLNQTRFGVVGLECPTPTGDDKTSILFSLEDFPGSLYLVLEIFAKAGINLTRIESRPARVGIGKYYFLLDFVGHREDPVVSEVLKEVQGQVTYLRVLGSYPCFRWQGSPARMSALGPPTHAPEPLGKAQTEAGRVAAKIAIIGLGLIGGSLGLALMEQPCIREVIGIDRDARAVEQALKRQAIHRGYLLDEAEEILKGVDTVFLAVPISEVRKTLSWLYQFVSNGCLVTDVASCKEGIVSFARTLSSNAVPFIGGHPLAGSEQKGIGAADRYLFENAAYILTPYSDSPLWAIEKLTSMIQSIGARVLFMSPGEHDRIVASISHLPHVVASALVNTAGGRQDSGSNAIALASGGFRDTTRVASSDPELWAGIILENREYVLEALEHFCQNLDRVRGWLLSAEGEYCRQHLCDWLAQARHLRASIPRRLRGLLPQQFDVIAEVPDKPGWIGLIGTLLGQHGINIADIQVLTVREGEAGSLRLSFAKAEEAEQAEAILKAGGVRARCREKKGA
ncbi:MAG: prephenate dehydratase [Clostridia bacterium]|nr:prephenate dehydratase [Clostridia bacterium]